MIPTTAELLKAFETVDHTDDAALDALNCQFWSWLTRLRIKKYIVRAGSVGWLFEDTVHSVDNDKLGMLPDHSPYHDITRSIDAQDKLLPDGYWIDVIQLSENEFKVIYTPRKGEVVQSAVLPTKALAGGHAIVQVIDYERTKCP